MDKVIEFANGSQIKIIETGDSSFRTRRYEVLMEKEDLEILWYLREVYTNENTLS